MHWDNPEKYPFTSGDLFLGLDHESQEIGVTPEVHAITFASSGTGKGAAVIIPNIKRWKANLLVVDPKGQNAKKTAEDREEMGQSVYVVDPFLRSGLDDRFIANFNPLEALNINSPTIAEDTNALADGIVMRGPDPSSENWDDGAQVLIAGVIAAVLLDGIKRTLPEVRDIISNNELLNSFAKSYENDNRLGGLLKAGAGRVLAKEGGYYISNARKNTAWLDSDPVRECFSKNNFYLSELKNGNAAVYLVLPANYLDSHSRFLRMFVRCAIEEMARPTPEGKDRGEECLFLLDEFFSLGFINEIAVSAGLMRDYGLHLWPFMQDLGQLVSLYGKEGAQTFFANADLVQFFGIKLSDSDTLSFVSRLTGTYTPDDIGAAPVAPNNRNLVGGIGATMGQSKQSVYKGTGMLLSGLSAVSGAVQQSSYNRQQVEYQQQAGLLNRPRLSEEQVAHLIAKKKDDVVASGMICLVFGTEFLYLKLAPYFLEEAQSKAQQLQSIVTDKEKFTKAQWYWMAGLMIIIYSIGKEGVFNSLLGF